MYQPIFKPPTDDNNTFNIRWKNEVLDEYHINNPKQNPVNQMPRYHSRYHSGYHSGYKIVVVYKTYAHNKRKFNSQFYRSDYGTSSWLCVVGNSNGIDGFDMYINSNYLPLKQFIQTHAKDVKYWQHL